jgi:hypothetical protein
MYSAIIFLVGLNIEINQVFTFQKILFPFVWMSYASFVNSKGLLGQWAKYECKACNRFSSRITKGNPNKVCIAKLVWWVMQWTLIK